MKLKNTENNYGLVAIFLHWGMAIIILGMFALGYWMVDLTYYSDWYRTAPFIHKSIGMILLMLATFRLVWKFTNIKPKDDESIPPLQRLAAHLAHDLLYLLLFSLLISGYLISTADGRGIDVFGWFEVPSLISGVDNMEDIAGLIHEYLAYALVGLAAVHAIAGIKHHVIDKDNTLLKMLGSNQEN